MTQEEKAEAYDDVREKIALRFGSNVAEEIFSGFEKSEDERVREALVDFFKKGAELDSSTNGIKDKTILAWLEKEGNSNNQNWKPSKEQINALEHFVRSIAESGYASPYDDNTKLLKSLINDLHKLEKQKDINALIQQAYKQGYTEGQRIERKHWLEKQDEQKPILDFKASNWYVSKVDGKIYDMTYNPTDNIEPKFKVGDWIAWEELNTAKIVNIDGDRYEVEFIDGNKGFPHIDYIDRLFHLWTILDAKPGDVLVCCDNKPFIFKGFFDLNFPNCLAAYCGVTLENQFGHCNGKTFWTNQDVKPATKEQCNLLFQKMHEAGYEWDAEKKELKKINSYCQENCKGYQETGKCFADGECDAKRKAEQKPTWSEEDERIYQSIMDDTVQENQLNNKQTDWLKDIKYRYFPQPKPTWSEDDED